MNPKLIDDLRKLWGLEPYDGPENTSRNDPYFAKAIERQYGKDIDTLTREAGLERR